MLRVVIIDGNSVSRGLLTSVLTTGGHDVVGEANTTPTGLAKMVKLRPQLVCLDISDSQSGGMALLDAVRMELPKALVFVVSSSIDAATIEQSLQRGVHGFIVKPFNSVTVLTAIRNAVLKLLRQQQERSEK